MTDLIPRLRPGLEILENATSTEFPAVLRDPALQQRMKLDPMMLATVSALQTGPASPEALVKAIGRDPELVQRAVTLLTQMHLLDTPQSRAFVTAARATFEVQAADPATVPLLIRDDARFGCTQCGSCCGGHNIGPVSESVLEGLAPHAEALVEATGTQKGLFFQLPVPTPSGELDTQHLCHTTGGWCVFLDDTGRCHIHARLGGDKKPAVCQLFPYQFTATPDGVAVSLQMECRAFSEARRGPALAAQEAELRRLLALAPRPTVRPMIALDGQTSLDWSGYMSVEDTLHAAVDHHASDPSAALIALRAVLERAAGADPNAAQPRTDRDALAVDLDRLMGGLGELCQQLKARHTRQDDRHIVRTGALDPFAAALTVFRSDLAWIGRKPRRTEIAALFAESAHHHLHGKTLTHARRLTLGLARLAFTWLLGRGVAITRARAAKRRHLVAQDVVDGTTVVGFLMRNTDFVAGLKPFDAAIESLFYHRLDALLSQADQLPDPDRRLELTKF